MGSLLLVFVLIAVVLCIPGIPGYVIAQRRGQGKPWIAFLPMFGLWIVLFESMGRSGLWALIGLVPYAGLLVSIWTGIEVPVKHGRSRWWTAALAVPVLNLIGYWVYAFTLPKQVRPALQHAVA
jgi:hypothetical protein